MLVQDCTMSQSIEFSTWNLETFHRIDQSSHKHAPCLTIYWLPSLSRAAVKAYSIQSKHFTTNRSLQAHEVLTKALVHQISGIKLFRDLLNSVSLVTTTNYKILAISWLAEELVASQAEPETTELVCWATNPEARGLTCQLWHCSTEADTHGGINLVRSKGLARTTDVPLAVGAMRPVRHWGASNPVKGNKCTKLREAISPQPKQSSGYKTVITLCTMCLHAKKPCISFHTE
jgi:hypothetical protein